MAYVGGKDVVYGDGGQDKLFGGGGDDELWGGADSDWLDGQAGSDKLYGGSGIDTLVLDTDAEYANSDYAEFSEGEPEVIDGHGESADDNATDILLIEGTNDDDQIFIGQMTYQPAQPIENDPRIYTRMVVEYNDRVMLVNWRSFDSFSDLNGLPLVEQFRISGLGGNDHIEFIRKSRKVSINAVEIDVTPLDVSDLTERSNDWVGVIDGGPDNDTLIGTDARDRIDGGRGDDTSFGYGGNDQLWGDGGPGQGNPMEDKDILYAGSGNDDLLGGQGTNKLYAWSFDPHQGAFGVYVDELGSYFDTNGSPFADDGDVDDDGRLDIDPTRPARKLEDTGLNRMLGGKKTDELYGGTGLDFMYGNGAPENAPDQLYSRTGELFDAADAGLAGNEWKTYAQSTNKVWYYSGSNLDDVIHVDFVTEPGLLQGHHLITRLTENTGNFTFDAQVRLDFKATDANGNLAWNPNDSFYGQTLVGTVTLPQNGQLASDLSFSLLVDGLVVPVSVLAAVTSSNTTRRHLVDSIQNALNSAGLGNIVDARLSGEVLSLVRVDGVAGKQAPLEVFSSSSVAQAELGLLPGQVSTNTFGGSFGLGSLLPPEDDFLAIIVDALDGDDHIIVGPTVIKSVWSDGGKGNDIIEHLSGTPILIDQTDYRTNGIGNGSKETAFPFGTIASNASGAVRGGQLMTGLTIDTPTDVDWYSFRLGNAYTGAGTLELRSLSKYDGMTMRLHVPQPNDEPPVIRQATGENPLSVSLADLQPNTEYFIEIRSNLNPTVYELEFVVGDASNTTLEQAVVLAAPLDQHRAILGRPVRFTGDEAWYQFQVSAGTESDASLVLHQLSGSGTLTVRLMNSSGQAMRTATSAGGSDAVLSLRGLVSDQEYYLNITGTSAGDYELIPKLGGSQIVDLSARTIRDFSDRLLKNIDRRDVLLGGDGNDILRGGSGEDWVFGGAGNDVLSGGNDRQAPDLLWGGPGDDIFQVIPDALPVLRSRPRSFDPDNEQTVLTTLTDRLDGGEGNDQVLFLGGDLDAAGNPIDDFVTMRWNTNLHRYELATRVWDTATRSHVTLTQPTAAEYVGSLPNFETQPLLKFGRLPLGPGAQPLVIRLMVNDGEEYVLTITPDSTRNNNRFEDLVLQLSAALEEAGLGGELTAVARNGRLAFRTVQTGIGASIAIQAPQGNEADLFTAAGLRATGTTPASGGNDAADYQYYYAFYTTLDTEHTVIDTRAGDDEVRADADFTIAGSQWGFGSDVRPQRGNPNLIIRGGAGNDRLFGGAGGDMIAGGDGDDVLGGGGGDDVVRGGAGNDYLAGDTHSSSPDRYEYLSGRANDEPGSAALLSDAMLLSMRESRPVKIEGSLHTGDRSDWYVFKTPQAAKAYGEAQAALVLKSMIELEFEGTAEEHALLASFGHGQGLSNSQDRLLNLFAAADTDSGSGLQPIPLDTFLGVPEYYLVQVTNPHALAIVGQKHLNETDRRIVGGATFDIEHAGLFYRVVLEESLASRSVVQLKEHIAQQMNAALPVDRLTGQVIEGLPGFGSIGGVHIDFVPDTASSRIALWLVGSQTELKIHVDDDAATEHLGLVTASVHRFDVNVGEPLRRLRITP